MPSSSSPQQRFSFYEPTTSISVLTSTGSTTDHSGNSNNHRGGHSSSRRTMGKDDEDLNDLLKEVRSDKNGGQEIEMAPLTGDSNGGGGLMKGSSSSSTQSAAPSFTLCELLFAYVTYTCEFAPKLCWTIGAILLVVPAYLLVMGVLANPTEHFGVISHDYSDITSEYDFKMGKIDHWCLGGDDSSCRCEDPMQPAPRAEFRSWAKAHSGNMDMISKLEEADMMAPDIAFLGGSVVEKMDGKWFGKETDQRLRDIAKTWSRHFTSVESTASDVDAPTAVALGISGDTNPSVLWRIQNGEMPKDFNPKVWWLELGLSDLGRQQCSEEVVVIGVLRVVEEILKKKPDAKIVINSLFPMTDLRTALNPNLKDLSGTYKPPRPSHGSRHSRSSNRNNPSGPRAIAPPNKRKDDHDRSRELRGSGFRHKHERSRVKMDPNKKSQHKYNAITHKEKKRLPLWTSITAVNRQLRKFAQKHERVFFFDATDIFTEREGKYYTLKTDLINVRGIPTEIGYDQWMKAVSVRTQKLLKDDDVPN